MRKIWRAPARAGNRPHIGLWSVPHHLWSSPAHLCSGLQPTWTGCLFSFSSSIGPKLTPACEPDTPGRLGGQFVHPLPPKQCLTLFARCSGPDLEPLVETYVWSKGEYNDGKRDKFKEKPCSFIWVNTAEGVGCVQRIRQSLSRGTASLYLCW